MLIERKNKILAIWNGYRYQLWAQWLCMKEMGYDINQIALYDISTKRTIPIDFPTEDELTKLESLIKKIRDYDPIKDAFTPKQNKCMGCTAYINICDKHSLDDVL